MHSLCGCTLLVFGVFHNRSKVIFCRPDFHTLVSGNCQQSDCDKGQSLILPNQERRTHFYDSHQGQPTGQCLPNKSTVTSSQVVNISGSREMRYTPKIKLQPGWGNSKAKGLTLTTAPERRTRPDLYTAKGSNPNWKSILYCNRWCKRTTTAWIGANSKSLSLDVRVISSF